MSDVERTQQHIRYYNANYRRRKPKNQEDSEKKTTFILKHRRVFAGALVLTTAITFYHVGKNDQETSIPTIPSGYVLTETVEEIDYGDTIYDIASEYYNASYTGIYPTLNDYSTAIQEQNGVVNPTRLNPGESLRLPVITTNQNDHFIKALQIQQQIDEIKQNEYWVEYTIKPGDTISALAAQASGDFRETPILTQQIIDKNKLSGILRDGTTILTINPALGPLKIELQEVQNQFQQSIKVDGLEQSTKVK